MSGSGGGGSIDMLSCANCGIGEENSNKLKKCSACLSVKYCSAECQKAHRPQHRKDCKKRAVQLHDEKLFKEVEPEECPICFLPLPVDGDHTSVGPCCGKRICDGCVYAMFKSEGTVICAFCRAPPASSDEESINLLNKLMEKGIAEAFNLLGGVYANGKIGAPQDFTKANELFLKGGELGSFWAYNNLGVSYKNGYGVEMNKKKAMHYFELAAMSGSIDARHNLACIERDFGNHDREYKHMMIAAKAGRKKSLDAVKDGFMKGFITKDEYANTLRVHHERQKEMKSDTRDKAAIIVRK